MSVVELPGYPGWYAHADLVRAWQAAGSPRPNGNPLRFYADQKRLWDGWAARRPGFSPADNPDNPNAPLVHMRGIGIDIDPTPARVASLSAAGLVRPYSYEPWHWQLPGSVTRYPRVLSLPAPAATTHPPVNPATADNESEDEMNVFLMTCEAVAGAGDTKGLNRWLVNPWEKSKRLISTEEEQVYKATGIRAVAGLQPKAYADLFRTVT